MEKNSQKLWTKESLGIIAPILFVSVFTLLGIFRKDYNAMATHISALSIGEFGWIQIINFMVFGLLLCLFSIQVHKTFSIEKSSKAGPIILFVTSICFFLSGPFIMDPMGTAKNAMTLHGNIHNMLGGTAFMLMPISCFVFYRRFRDDAKWNDIKGGTLIFGVLLTLTLVFFIAVTQSEYLNTIFYNWQGIIQRAVIIPYMLWLLIFALKMQKIINEK